MIELINQKQKEIEVLNPAKTWDLKFLEKIKIDFTYYSNKLECNSLTYGQTMQFLKNIGEKKCDINAPIKDYLDIEKHYKLLDQVFTIYNEDFSVNRILEMHKLLMYDSQQWDYESFYSPGNFKTRENFTVKKTGKIHQYLEPQYVNKEMDLLIGKVNLDTKHFNINSIDKHPITSATYLHNRFMEIHPFEDGNGRIGRILTNMVLLKSNLPPIFISHSNRENYLELFEVSNSTNLDKMRDFFSEKLIESLEAKKQMIMESLKLSPEVKPQKKSGLGI